MICGIMERLVWSNCCSDLLKKVHQYISFYCYMYTGKTEFPQNNNNLEPRGDCNMINIHSYM